jgi:hypothetical protein
MPLRGGEGGTRNMTGKVGADTGCVDHPNANGGALALHRSGIVDAAPLRHQRGRASVAGTRAIHEAMVGTLGELDVRLHSGAVRWTALMA